MSQLAIDCVIGEGTKVWQFASVIRGARIGRDCNIATCAIVDAAKVGDRCIIGHGAFIGPGSHLGDDVFVGPNVTICNDTWPRAAKDGFDMAALLKGRVVTVRIENGASIGAGAVILPGVTVRSHAMVAAGSVVVKDVPAAHLHKRNGSCVPIDARPIARMRAAALAL